MAANFLTTILSTFSWIKIYKFRLRFYLSLFPSVQLTIPILALILVQAIIWTYFADACMRHSAPTSSAAIFHDIFDDDIQSPKLMIVDGQTNLMKAIVVSCLLIA